MKSYKALIATALIATACCISVNVSAKNKCVQKLYAFGFAASFNDSTVYFTDIQEIDSAWVNEKNEFLEIKKVFPWKRSGNKQFCQSPRGRRRKESVSKRSFLFTTQKTIICEAQAKS